MAQIIRGLWQHKNGFWYFSRMRDGVKKTVALNTKDPVEAKRRALEVVDHPKLALSGSLESEIDEFVEFKLSRNEFSRFSAENKKLTLKRFASWIGSNKPIPSIKAADLQRFYEHERKRVTESTAQGYMMSVRSFFGWLVEERKVIPVNPAVGVKMAKWDYGKRTEYCSPEIRDALLKAWPNIPSKVLPKSQAHMVAFVLHCGFDAGLRRNEIIEARPQWFRKESRTIYVQGTDTFRPKDREARHIPLTDVFLKFLESYSMTGKWCIAPNCERGKSRYRYDFLRPFEIYRDHVSKELEQDLTWITPHVLRHTFGSLLAIAGESLTKISKWMGDDPRVTERHYLHMQEGDTAVNKLHSFSPQPPPV